MAKFIPVTGAHKESPNLIWINVEGISSFGDVKELESKAKDYPFAKTAIERDTGYVMYVQEEPYQILMLIEG